MSQNTLRRRTYDFLELGSFGSRWAAAFEVFMVLLILANVVAVALETVPSLWARYGPAFALFDNISLTIFAVEYALRVWASAEREAVAGDSVMRRRLRYILSPLAVLDLVVIAPLFLGAFVTTDLRELRIFRLLRLLKLVRFSPALSSLGRVVVAERRALFATLVVMTGLLFLSSTLMYHVERAVQPDKFGSIPDALWWALATLTTVGYGDVVPATAVGKIIAGATMVLGLGFYALPIGIIASGFSDEVHRREFIVPIGLIEDFPAFSRLPRQAAKELSERMRTLVLTPGTVLTHRFDRDNGLYLVISGELSAFYHHRAVPMRAGDFVGECGMISDTSSQPATVAKTRVRVMWLESTDMHILLSLYPEMAKEIQDYTVRRLADLVEDGYLSADERLGMIKRQQDWMVSAQLPV